VVELLISQGANVSAVNRWNSESWFYLFPPFSVAAVLKPQLLSFRRVLYNAICRGFYMILWTLEQTVCIKVSSTTALRATEDEGPRTKVQWNRALLLDESHKLNLHPLSLLKLGYVVYTHKGLAMIKLMSTDLSFVWSQLDDMGLWFDVYSNITER
jgi:hypothetical protein